ncbi:MAG: protein-methionine-sulfoxide reductase catalytic subunit MsrP [Rhodospirillaceae bacterium]|nr:protein-methionine-sulfoxide reductase catalytic subunit MsrP [Rhodospirillaceae bacterium]|tara:strand:+ start:3452 stop:4456 length:1005 start_codon:yes stop_codon:yes gene_type:complete
MLIKSPQSWEIPERLATSESVYLNRRQLAKAIAAGPIVAAAASMPFGAARAEEEAIEMANAQAAADPTLDLYPAPLNDAYADAGRSVTPEIDNLKYNNFYEFGSHKTIWQRAEDLKRRPWAVTFDGLVEEEKTVDIDTLIRAMNLKERVYRHRCVEAWSMVVPWTGFPLRDLVAFAKPLGSAKYVVMQTFEDSDMAPGQEQFWYPWPYTEGVTVEEAENDLAFMVTGAYGQPMANQFGAPLRLHLPWKYGFKSVKSIVRVTLTEERPTTFWKELVDTEYGFWANVNPDVAHPRWSQAEERVLGTNEKIPTVIYNGYGEQVASLYAGMEGENLFM